MMKFRGELVREILVTRKITLERLCVAVQDFGITNFSHRLLSQMITKDYCPTRNSRLIIKAIAEFLEMEPDEITIVISV